MNTRLSLEPVRPLSVWVNIAIHASSGYSVLFKVKGINGLVAHYVVWLNMKGYHVVFKHTHACMCVSTRAHTRTLLMLDVS